MGFPKNYRKFSLKSEIGTILEDIKKIFKKNNSDNLIELYKEWKLLKYGK